MPPFTQADITRAAQSMIRDFGCRAAGEAAGEAAKALAEKRVTAAIAWRQIETEINRLQSKAEANSSRRVENAPDGSGQILP